MFNNLGMTGWWIFEEEPHNHFKFELSENILFFNDPRNFGNVIISNRINLENKLEKLGADIFNTNDIDKFNERLIKKQSSAMIANALLDQKVVSGCGNYLRAECLYLSKISPFREIKNLSNKDINIIWNILNQLAWYYYNEKLGIKKNIIDGKYKLSVNYNIKKMGPSKYKPREGIFHVYRQKKDEYDNKVEKKELNNRTIYYVPACQT
jgi:formamidopyrimidine-DNA glycosylase